MLLERGIHFLFDRGDLVFVPRDQHYVCYFLGTAHPDMTAKLHNRRVKLHKQMRPEFLFARFAWKLFKNELRSNALKRVQPIPVAALSGSKTQASDVNTKPGKEIARPKKRARTTEDTAMESNSLERHMISDANTDLDARMTGEANGMVNATRLEEEDRLDNDNDEMWHQHHKTYQHYEQRGEGRGRSAAANFTNRSNLSAAEEMYRGSDEDIELEPSELSYSSGLSESQGLHRAKGNQETWTEGSDDHIYTSEGKKVRYARLKVLWNKLDLTNNAAAYPHLSMIAFHPDLARLEDLKEEFLQGGRS